MYIQTQREGDQVKVQVKEWGNSHGIRIPAAVLQMLGIKASDKLDLQVEDNRIVLQKAFKHKTFRERLEEYDGNITICDFDWGTPAGKEMF